MFPEFHLDEKMTTWAGSNGIIPLITYRCCKRRDAHESGSELASSVRARNMVSDEASSSSAMVGREEPKGICPLHKVDGHWRRKVGFSTGKSLGEHKAGSRICLYLWNPLLFLDFPFLLRPSILSIGSHTILFGHGI